MKHKTDSVAIMLAGFAAICFICGPMAGAQTTTAATTATTATTPTTAPAAVSDDSKPSPYSGVSKPPSDDEIVATPDLPPAKVAVPAAAQRAVAPAAASYALPSSFNNQDSDLVTSVDRPDRPGAGALQRRNAGPRSPESDDDLMVTSLDSKPGELAEGTNLKVRLLEPLSTAETQKGEAFSGLVTTDVTESGKVVVPMGSELRGQVVFVRAGSKIGSRATLHLRPDVLILPDGSRYALQAQVIGTQGSSAKADSEGGIVPKSHLKKDSIEYGAAAGSGAIIGAQIAGGVGALVGAGIGAGLVTTHLLLQDHQAELPKNSVVVFGLTEPMTLTSVQN